MVEEMLAQFFERSKKKAAELDSGYLELWEAIEASTVGGKRIRPRMVMRAYELCGGLDPNSAATAGAAFELLHTALVIHDDVIDRDYVRRGVPNVSGRYRSRALGAGVTMADATHVGASVGVIAGDLALSQAYSLLADVEAPAKNRRAIMRLLDHAVFTAAAGEYLDVDATTSPTIPPPELAVMTSHLKTAVYTFEAPLQVGATLAGASESVIAALGRFGREIGVAFQLVDDLLGVFGTESRTGKTTLGDLREGKRTALIIYAASQPGWDSIAPLIGSPRLSRREAAYIRSVLINMGAKSYVTTLAEDHVRRARDHLMDGRIPERLREGLEPLVTAVISRVC
ncbi:polyprenyl synthetase family protein [Arthrobacter tecti]